MPFEILAVVGYPGKVILLDIVEGVGKTHVAVPMVVAVRFPISSNVYHLVMVSSIIEAGHETMGEDLSGHEQSFESYGPRYRTIVEKDGNTAAGR
ncbi:MAG: hypothetical protein A4E57_04649 [Syntrophorhabdaceae bacterium PtaU1.Bin034]|nr:MAG: hypothetical protein A4E57_04649 [Syntrophorhabdaceae bacterium PtaU1.Bin034]